MKTIKLHFTAEEMDLLWHYGCRSFIEEQTDRFEFIHGEDKDIILSTKENSYLRFCDSFLDAKVLACLLEKESIIVFDLNQSEWCVWSLKPI